MPNSLERSLKNRRKRGGFVIFAAAFWLVVAALVSLLSFLIPALWGRSCLTRILFGLGSVVGFFAAGLMFSCITPENTQPWHISTLVVAVSPGCVLGAILGAKVASYFEGPE